MRRHPFFVALFLTFLTGCGGGGAPIANQSISGPYEFVVTSNVNGSTTLIEANFSLNGSNSNAAGPTQVQILTQYNKTWYVNGVCFGATPGQNSIAADVNGSNVAMTFNDGGNTFSGQGVITGNAIAGNYALNGSKCLALNGIIDFPNGTDSGGFTGNQVPALSGTFSGPLSLISGTDNATFTLTEADNHDLTVNATLIGPADNGMFAFSGSAVGNVMFVSGLVNGKNLSLFGYFDRTGQFTGTSNSVLVFNYDTLTQAGLLIAQ